MLIQTLGNQQASMEKNSLFIPLSSHIIENALKVTPALIFFCFDFIGRELLGRNLVCGHNCQKIASFFYLSY